MSTPHLISFCNNYLKNSKDVLEGDSIRMKNESLKIRNANDVNNWLNSIKMLLGKRMYNSMKSDFESSIAMDVGFTGRNPDLYDDIFNRIHEV